MKYLGKIIFIEHGINLKHPFIILWESKKKVIALQCSSIDYDKYKNKYSIFNIEFYQQKINDDPDIVNLDEKDGLKFHSQVDLNIIYTFKKDNLNLDDIKNELNFCTYCYLINKLYKKTFNKEIDEMIEAACNKCQ